MRPEIFRIPGLDLPLYGFGMMIVVGFLLGIYLAQREGRRRGLPPFMEGLGMAFLAAGVLGGRLFYYIQNYQLEFASQPWYAFFQIWKGGLVFYGGAIGGLAGGLAYLLAKRLPVGDCLDATAPFVPVGIGFGRLGCLMNGCCYGKVCSDDYLLGLIFPKENRAAGFSPAFDEQVRQGLVLVSDPAPLPVFPTQLFEAAYVFLLCGLLAWYLRGPSPRHGGFPLLFILYGVGRFFIEFFRGDNPATPTGLTISQNFSLALVAIFGVAFIFLWRKDLRLRQAPGAEPRQKTGKII